MARIERLTPEQIARFPEFVEKWRAIGLRTDPAERGAAEAAIARMYAIAGLQAPKTVWCGSPLSQGLTRSILLDKKNGASVRESVWASVRESVWESVRESVGASVWESVGASVWESVRASVGESVGASVWESVRESVRESVGASVGASVRASVGESVYGQHDASWLAFYDYFRDVCNLHEHTEKLQGLWLLAQSAGWALPHKNICLISERHNVVHQDDRWRLHCPDGPALMYPDGFGIWAWHGVRVSQQLIESPSTITIEQIRTEQNAEIRRVMIDRFGAERYLRESGAKLIHQHKGREKGLAGGKLWRTEIPGDEPLVMVELENSTPEPDGEIKHYMLRVPPDLQTVHQAVAWTFGRTAEEYAPVKET